MPATQTGPRTVPLASPPDDRKKPRHLAADHDTNMALLARNIVQESIPAHRPKFGAK
jgi:hypothetical protein